MLHPRPPATLVSIHRPATTVDWHFGNHCQFSCSYCPQHLHAGTSPALEQDVLRDFVMAIEEDLTYDLANQQHKINFNFSGGEPTLNPNFGPFILWLRQRGHVVSVTTNGGRTLRWWQEWGQHIDHTVFSFHTEFTDLDHYEQVARHQAQHSAEARLIAAPQGFHRIQEAWLRLQGIPQLRVMVKPIIDAWADGPDHQSLPYTAEQRAWLSQHRSNGQRPRRRHDEAGTRVTDITGTQRRQHAIRILQQQENDFRGWRCLQGVKNISVTEQGQVFGAHCRQLPMGSIHAPQELRWPRAATICGKPACWCLTDIAITKWKEH